MITTDLFRTPQRFDQQSNQIAAPTGIVQGQQTYSPSGQRFVAPRTVTTNILPYFPPPAQPQQTTARAASSSTSQARPDEGLSVSELQLIKQQTGAGQQPAVTRDNSGNEAAARAAAFARAKEQSANIARSSLAGLRNLLARRGITGGGYAQQRTAEALAPAADQLQDFTREQLIQDLGQARHVADTEYSGEIAQRGQNQASVNALLSLINSRGRLY